MFVSSSLEPQYKAIYKRGKMFNFYIQSIFSTLVQKYKARVSGNESSAYTSHPNPNFHLLEDLTSVYLADMNQTQQSQS